jgi:hypothetical protein
MLDSAVKSPFNNGNGLGSGTYVKTKGKKKKNKNDQKDFNDANYNFFGIFDELADVISSELKAMERAKRVNINFDTRF